MSHGDDLDPSGVVWHGYAPRASGAVTALPILDGREVRGYVWFADDPAENAAGTVGVLRGDPAGGNSVVPRAGRLRDAYAEGLSARDAVLGLAGTSDPDPRLGVVQTETASWPSLDALRAAANPPGSTPVPEGRGRGAAARPAMVRPLDSDRDEIDAVLRGEAESTPAVRARIEALDAALAGRPTPDPVVVWLPASAAHLGDPDGLEGRTFEEPTYLRTRFDTKDADFGEAAVVVKLRVPAGVPALWLEHAGGDPAAAGLLLLGRGLRWTASHVVRTAERTVVFGFVAEPAAVPSAGDRD